jgi:hypothetical protein
MHHFTVKVGKREVEVVSDRAPSKAYTAELLAYIRKVEG